MAFLLHKCSEMEWRGCRHTDTPMFLPPCSSNSQPSFLPIHYRRIWPSPHCSRSWHCTSRWRRSSIVPSCIHLFQCIIIISNNNNKHHNLHRLLHLCRCRRTTTTTFPPLRPPPSPPIRFRCSVRCRHSPPISRPPPLLCPPHRRIPPHTAMRLRRPRMPSHPSNCLRCSCCGHCPLGRHAFLAGYNCLHCWVRTLPLFHLKYAYKCNHSF